MSNDLNLILAHKAKHSKDWNLMFLSSLDRAEDFKKVGADVMVYELKEYNVEEPPIVQRFLYYSLGEKLYKADIVREVCLKCGYLNTNLPEGKRFRCCTRTCPTRMLSSEIVKEIRSYMWGIE